jgi:hypothetical protein
MTAITEGRQRLAFDATWQVVEWDEADEFKGSMDFSFSGLPGRSVKAADAVGVRRRRGVPPLLLIAEFKDFDRTHLSARQQARIAAQGVSADVMRDVIAKVIDSLCGAGFAHDASGARLEALERWRSAVGLQAVAVLVLVCAELPVTQAVAAVTWTTELKRRLRWLGPRSRVLVTNRHRPFQGVGLEYSVTP